jgi:hypothetical protein
MTTKPSVKHKHRCGQCGVDDVYVGGKSTLGVSYCELTSGYSGLICKKCCNAIATLQRIAKKMENGDRKGDNGEVA